MIQQPYKLPSLYVTDLYKPLCSYISCYDINACTPRPYKFLHKQAFLKLPNLLLICILWVKKVNIHH